MPKQTSLFSDSNYAAFLNGLKARIRSAQVKAALAGNQELILLYWQIGKDILTRQQTEGWGAKVIERLAKDLKRELHYIRWGFPDAKFYLCCGEGLVSACRCGEPILLRAKFCPECGVKHKNSLKR